MTDELRELDRQVDRGSLFAHEALTEQAAKINEAASVVNGLVGLLVQRGLVDANELMAVIDSVRTETEKAGQHARINVTIREDGKGSEHDGPPVDCSKRVHICHAVCCRLRFPLTVDEINNGPLKWDLGRPYYNRVDADGFCQKFDRDSRGCTVYEERPTPCRGYTCENDERIWTDFENMVLNHEYIEARLVASPVDMYMLAPDGG